VSQTQVRQPKSQSVERNPTNDPISGCGRGIASLQRQLHEEYQWMLQDTTETTTTELQPQFNNTAYYSKLQPLLGILGTWDDHDYVAMMSAMPCPTSPHGGRLVCQFCVPQWKRITTIATTEQ
jgi:hypothetical protein